MKGFGKGLALFFVILCVSSLLQILLGAEEGSVQHAISISIGCIVAYPVSRRFDATKPMLVVSIIMCALAVINFVANAVAGIAPTAYLFMLVGPIITLVLSLLDRHK